MRRPAPLVLAIAVCATTAPGVAHAAPSVWTGWRSVGPPPRVGATIGLAAAGRTVVVLGDDANRQDELLRFAVTSARGAGSGVVPPATDAKGRVLSDDTHRGYHRVALAGPDRIVISHVCEVRTSSDLGRRWSSAVLPGCRTDPTLFDAPQLAFADAGHGIAVQGRQSWSTTDGGRSWRLASAAADGDLVGAAALSATAFVRVVSSPVERSADVPDATPVSSVERSDDGGRTWQAVPLPVPPVTAGAPPRPVGSPATTTALPAALSAPVRRADGAVLVGGPGELLVSTDGARTFSGTPVPAAASAPGAIPDAAGTSVGIPLCDPTSRCVLPRSVDAVRFEDGVVGGEVPAPPPSPVAPAPGRILGLTTVVSSGSRASGSIVSSDDLGATYVVAEHGSYGDTQAGSTSDASGALVTRRTGASYVSLDRGRTFRVLREPLFGAGPGGAVDVTSTPRDPAVVTVGYAPSPGGLVRLGSDGHLRRVDPGPGGSDDLADLSALDPYALASARGATLVAGTHGLARVSSDGVVRTLRTRLVPAPSGASGLRARGSTAAAWAGRTLLVSADAGRTWRRVRPPAGLADLEVVGPRTLLALVSDALLRSDDAGRTFRRIGTVPPIRPLYRLRDQQPNIGIPTPSIDFADARRGVVVTDDGAFLTTDGGRSLTPVPAPSNQPPAGAFVSAGTRPRVTVVDDATGVLYRQDRAASSPSHVTLRRSGSVHRSGSRRAQDVTGKLRGGPPGAFVQLLARGPDGERQASPAATTDRAGRFAARVRLRPDERTVRAVFAGLVTDRRTFGSGSSPPRRVPATGRDR